MVMGLSVKSLVSLVLAVICVGMAIAMLAGASWYGFKQDISVSMAGETFSTSTQLTFFLSKAEFVTTIGGKTNTTSETYAEADKATASSTDPKDKKTNCVGAGNTALGLTVGNLILHVGFIAILFVQKGKFQGAMKFAAIGVLVIGLILQCVAVALFATDTNCAKYLYDTAKAASDAVIASGAPGVSVSLSVMVAG